MSTVTVVGASGIGTVPAAGLVEAGHEVVVCARSTETLVVERDGVSREVGATVVTDPPAVTVSDWVLLCVKAPDTESAGPWLRRAYGPSTRVLVCQNGIDHVERVAALIGPATAVPSPVYIAAERIGAGRVRHRRSGHIVVPDDPEGRRATELGSAALEVCPEEDLHSAAWRKLLTNVAANAITALTRRRMEVLADPTALLTEAVQVGRATGARFPEIDWRITAGNSSPISDGASAVLLASPQRAHELGLTPRARIHGTTVVGDDPLLMLTGPIPATRSVLDRTGLRIEDLDAYEVNEAFVQVPPAWAAELDADDARLNMHGGAIALGHPLGASGARLLTTLLGVLDELDGRFGLQTMCEAGGMANAMVVERLDARA